MSDIVLVIGASSDIGVELIRAIGGDDLIIAHYFTSKSKLEEVQSEISNRIVLLRADLTVDVELQRLLDEVEAEYGTPNKIVHLAAPRLENIRFKDVSWSDFERDIGISLKSAVMTLNRFLPKLAKEKRGKVVVMLSSCVLGIPPKTMSNYVTVKYALWGLVKSLASEYGDKHVTINSVSPSMIETKFLANINEKIIEISAEESPLRRNAKVEDVVPVIKMLLSPESDYINGVNIPVTAGSI